MRADNKRKLAAPITTDGSMYFDGKLWRQNKRADQISRLFAPEAYEIAAKAKAAAMSADKPSVEELNTDRRMEILTDDEIADIQRQLDCHQVVDNDLVQAALATIANLRSRLSHPTLSAETIEVALAKALSKYGQHVLHENLIADIRAELLAAPPTDTDE